MVIVIGAYWHQRFVKVCGYTPTKSAMIAVESL
jgi:hypothetical protein